MGDITIIQWIDNHGLFCLFIYWLTSAAVGALNAPTKDSGAFYTFFFKFINVFASNVFRAYKTRIEGSPNWNDAVTKAINGSNKTDAPPPKNPLQLS